MDYLVIAQAWGGFDEPIAMRARSIRAVRRIHDTLDARPLPDRATHWSIDILGRAKGSDIYRAIGEREWAAIFPEQAAADAQALAEAIADPKIRKR